MSDIPSDWRKYGTLFCISDEFEATHTETAIYAVKIMKKESIAKLLQHIDDEGYVVVDAPVFNEIKNPTMALTEYRWTCYAMPKVKP